MLAGLFRSNQPVVLAGMLVLVPVLFGASFLNLFSTPDHTMPLHGLLLRLFAGSAWSQAAISIVLVSIIGIQLTLLVNDTELLDRRTHLPALLFPLLYAAFGPAASLDPALAGMPLVVPAMHRAWTMSNTGRVMGALFDAGLLIGLAALFYLPYAFLVVVIWASVSVIRPFHWREYLVPVVGCAVVIYFCWGILVLTGADEWRPLLTIGYAHAPGAIIAPVPSSQRILLFMVLAGFLAVGILAFSRGYHRGIMRQKNIRSSFLAFTAALAILLVFVWLLTGVLPPVMVAVPLTLFCAQAIQGSKKAWIGEAGVLSLLILGLWAQWGW